MEFWGYNPKILHLSPFNPNPKAFKPFIQENLDAGEVAKVAEAALEEHAGAVRV